MPRQPRVDRADPIAVVYWLYDETCTFPEESGYVGACTNMARRLAHHRRFFGTHKGAVGVPPDFKIKILFTGTLVDCDAMERELRPFSNIGWNRYRGGRRSLSATPNARALHKRFGRKPRSPDHNEKISRTLLRGKPRQEHTKYGSPEYYEKLKQRKTRKGISASLETRDKIRQTQLKRLANPAVLANLSERVKERWRDKKYRAMMTSAMKGKVGTTPKSEETKAKMRAAALARYANPDEKKRTSKAVRKALHNIVR